MRPPRPVPYESTIQPAAIKSANASTNAYSRIPVSVLAGSEVDLRLRMDDKPARGEQICVELLLEDNRCVITSGIVHWTEMRGTMHEVGIFLTEKLPAWVACDKENGHRKAERYRCRIPGKLTSGVRRAESDGIIVNYSYEGLAIRCPIGGCVDEKFSFRWIVSNSVRKITGTILWQIEQNGGFLMGAELSPGSGYRIAGL